MAGRPPKNKVVEVVKEETVIDIQAMIAQAVSQALAEKDKEIEKLKEENKNVTVENKVEQVEVKQRNYKFIPSNTKVRVKSNINGLFTWNEDRGKVRVFIELRDSGDNVLLDYDEFKVVANKTFFRKAMLAITDVYSENDDINIIDLAKDINIPHLYDGKITANNLEDLFLESVSFDEYKSYIESNKEIAESVLDIAYKLYKLGRFNNNQKIEYLRQGFNNQNLFR